MFEMETFYADPINREYAEKRMRNEPIVEVTQVKGTSETHPLLSPDDEWADFEIMDVRVGSRPPTYSRAFGSYVREAYLNGLTLEFTNQGNPYNLVLLVLLILILVLVLLMNQIIGLRLVFLMVILKIEVCTSCSREPRVDGKLHEAFNQPRSTVSLNKVNMQIQVLLNGVHQV